jgi:hypothetical protein
VDFGQFGVSGLVTAQTDRVRFRTRSSFGRSSRLRRCGWAPNPGGDDRGCEVVAELGVLGAERFELGEEFCRAATGQVGVRGPQGFKLFEEG